MPDAFAGSQAGGSVSQTGIPNPLSTGAGVGGAVGGGIGDIIGWFLSQGDRDTARALANEATNDFRYLNPNIQPQWEKTFSQGPSAFDKLGMDPTGRMDQLAALDKLKSIYDSGGLDPTAKAQIAEAQMAGESQANAQNNALLSQASQRGMLDSGSLMAAQRANAQAGANRTGMESIQAAGDASQRGMQALNSYLGGASAVRGQDYGQASDRATAEDAIARFNAANSQAVQGRNVDRNMAGQEQSFQNGMGRAGAINGQGSQYNNMANQTQQAWGAGGQGIGAAAGMGVAAAGLP